MLINTPIANVAAKPCTMEAPKVSANQNKITQVIKVDTLPSLIAGQALLNPTFIDVNNVRPDRNSSFIRSKIKMLASTAMPTDKIAAETPDRVKVTGINLNTVIKVIFNLN